MSFYESPAFISLLIGTVYVLLVLTLLLVAWSVFHSMRMRRRAERGYGGTEVRGYGAMRWLSWIVAFMLLATLGITCMLATTDPLTINGRPFCDVFWLRVSDMLIWSALILMLVAGGCVVFAMSGIMRKRH